MATKDQRFSATPPGVSPAIGIGGLVLAQALDVATTLWGLAHPGIVELNPVAATLISAYGTLPALAALYVLTVGSVVAVTEWAARAAAVDDRTGDLIRLLGYVPLTALSLAVAGNNLYVILQA